MGLSVEELKQIIAESGVTGDVGDALQVQLEPHLADQNIYTKKDRRSGADRRQQKATLGNLVNARGQAVQRIFRLPGEKEAWGHEKRAGSDRRMNADA